MRNAARQAGDSGGSITIAFARERHRSACDNKSQIRPHVCRVTRSVTVLQSSRGTPPRRRPPPGPNSKFEHTPHLHLLSRSVRVPFATFRFAPAPFNTVLSNAHTRTHAHMSSRASDGAGAVTSGGAQDSADAEVQFSTHALEFQTARSSNLHAPTRTFAASCSSPPSTTCSSSVFSQNTAQRRNEDAPAQLQVRPQNDGGKIWAAHSPLTPPPPPSPPTRVWCFIAFSLTQFSVR